jgi:hypothetical protein
MIHRIVPELPTTAWRTLEPLSFSVAEQQKKQECYLCGKLPAETPEGKLTREHLPPQNLFLEPRPSNLITVPCCNACNNGASEDDDYLRLAVSGYYNHDELGKQTWTKKVLGSTMRKKRLQKEIAAFSNSLKRIALITPQGVEDAFDGRLEGARMERSVTRLTKGFLGLLYPGVDRTELKFQVAQLDPFKVNDPVFAQARSILTHFQRGKGAFRCWHAVQSYSHTGMWVYMFFSSFWFLVSHSSDRKIVPPW